MPSSKKKKKRLAKGFVNILLVALVVVLGIVLSGIFTGPKFEPGKGGKGMTSFACCDKGNGDECTPYEEDDKTFEYNGTKYGLLKSNFTLIESVLHLKDSG